MHRHRFQLRRTGGRQAQRDVAPLALEGDARARQQVAQCVVRRQAAHHRRRIPAAHGFRQIEDNQRGLFAQLDQRVAQRLSGNADLHRRRLRRRGSGNAARQRHGNGQGMASGARAGPCSLARNRRAPNHLLVHDEKKFQ
jgi:hypothetical protein